MLPESAFSGAREESWEEAPGKDSAGKNYQLPRLTCLSFSTQDSAMPFGEQRESKMYSHNSWMSLEEDD